MTRTLVIRVRLRRVRTFKGRRRRVFCDVSHLERLLYALASCIITASSTCYGNLLRIFLLFSGLTHLWNLADMFLGGVISLIPSRRQRHGLSPTTHPFLQCLNLYLRSLPHLSLPLTSRLHLIEPLPPRLQHVRIFLDVTLELLYSLSQYFLLLGVFLFHLLHVFLQFPNFSGPSLPEGTLSFAVLCFSLGGRCINGGLSARLGLGRKNPCFVY